MSRKPLSSRNAEHPPRRGAPGPKSKKKGRGFTINIAILVSDFNNILNEVNLYGPVVITEDDLRSPAVGLYYILSMIPCLNQDSVHGF